MYDNVYDLKGPARQANLRRRALIRRRLITRGVKPSTAMVTQELIKQRQIAKARRLNLPASGLGSKSGYRGSANRSWLTNAFQAMIATKQFAVTLTPYSEIAVTNASAVQHGYSSLRGIITGAQAAVRGAANKDIQSAALSAAVFNVTAGAAATGIRTFGWRLRLTASALNYAYRPFIVDVGPVLNTAGVLSIPSPVVTFAVISRRMPCDVIVLSPSNAAGLLTIVEGTQAEVVAAAATTTNNGISVRSLGDANSFAVFETLNARDLISRPTQLVGEGACSDEEEDAVYDTLMDEAEEEEDDGLDTFPGIRDGI